MFEVTPQELGILVVLRKAGKPLPRKSIGVELGYDSESGNYLKRGLKKLCDLGLLNRLGETTKTLRYDLTHKQFPVVKLKTDRRGLHKQTQKLTVEHLFPQALSGQL